MVHALEGLDGVWWESGDVVETFAVRELVAELTRRQLAQVPEGPVLAVTAAELGVPVASLGEFTQWARGLANARAQHPALNAEGRGPVLRQPAR